MPTASLGIPDGVIKDAIAVAIAEAFAPEKRDQIVRDIVRAHLEVKADGYSRETLLAKRVGDTIRTVAGEEVDRVIKEELAAKIRAATAEILGPQWQDSCVDSFRSALRTLTLNQLRVIAVPEP